MAFFIPAISAPAQTKIDPWFDVLPKAATVAKAHLLSAGGAESDAAPAVDVLIKSTDVEATRRAIEAAGGAMHAVIGSIVSAELGRDALAQVAAGEEIVFIEAPKPIAIMNDVAGAEIGSTEVHTGTGLPAPLTGKGVIVGVIDTGVDYANPAFRDGNGKSRVLAIWDQKNDAGSGPSEIQNSYGTECLADEIDSGGCPMRDVDGHGTHVAGTIAAQDGDFSGVAPDANIVVVGYDAAMDLSSGYADTIFSSKICQAAYYVFAKASKLGLPAVVNLSLGTHIGAHDGTSLFEECLAGLIEGSTGRAIVAAAGNERSTDDDYTGIHAGFELEGTRAANFVIRQISRDRIYYIDLWGTRGGSLSVGLAIRKGSPAAKPLEYSSLVGPGNTSEGSFLGGRIEYMINTTEKRSALNDKPHAGIRITLDPSVMAMADYSFDLVVSGQGSVDAWIYPDKPAKVIQFTSVAGAHGADWSFVAGDKVKNVAIPATSPGIIAVGGYTSRNKWEGSSSGCCQIAYELGELLGFSSSGPTAEPEATGPKPEIAAPGGMIASTLSRDAAPNPFLILKDGQHLMQAGTSMAAPFVTGTIALMFSANPNYTFEDALRYLTESAYKDSFTGDVPNDRWGWGKLNTLGAVEAALAGGASGSFDNSAAAVAPQVNATSGKSSCQMIPSSGRSAAALPLFVFIGVLAIAARRRASIKIG